MVEAGTAGERGSPRTKSVGTMMTRARRGLGQVEADGMDLAPTDPEQDDGHGPGDRRGQGKDLAERARGGDRVGHGCHRIAKTPPGVNVGRCRRLTVVVRACYKRTLRRHAMRKTRSWSFVIAGLAVLALSALTASQIPAARSAGTPEFDSCTSILVGRLASVDGSTMTSHSCDSGTDRTWMTIVPNRKHKPGEMAKVYYEPKRTKGPERSGPAGDGRDPAGRGDVRLPQRGLPDHERAPAGHRRDDDRQPARADERKGHHRRARALPARASSGRKRPGRPSASPTS